LNEDERGGHVEEEEEEEEEEETRRRKGKRAKRGSEDIKSRGMEGRCRSFRQSGVLDEELERMRLRRAGRWCDVVHR